MRFPMTLGDRSCDSTKVKGTDVTSVEVTQVSLSFEER